MNGNTEDKIRGWADHALLILVSRLAMAATPFVATALVSVGSLYLDARFAEQGSIISGMSTRLERVEGRVDSVGAVISAARTERAVTDATLARTVEQVDKTADTVDRLVSSVSALLAVVRAQEGRPGLRAPDGNGLP